MLASYVHLHFQSNPSLAPAFVRHPARYRSIAIRPLYGALRAFCSRCERRIAVGAPQARPPERSGDHGAPRAEAWGVRGGEAPRIWLVREFLRQCGLASSERPIFSNVTAR